ncbi:hypothetical protein T484DRAFT_1781226, partial [Baffinella frigidus]
ERNAIHNKDFHPGTSKAEDQKKMVEKLYTRKIQPLNESDRPASLYAHNFEHKAGT